jgi:predicted Zn-dependent peptidase
MNRNDVYDYYKNNYVPNNMIMSIVGNFQTDSMLLKIKKIYGKEKPALMKRPANPDWLIGFDIPAERSDKAGRVFQRFYKGENNIAQLFYPLPAEWTVTHFIIFDEILSKIQPELTESLSKVYPQIEKSFETETIQSPIKSFLKISVTISDQGQLNEMVNAINNEIKKLKFRLPEESVKFLATAKKTTFLKNVEKPHMFGIYNAGIFAEGGIEAVLESYSTLSYAPAALDLSTYFIWEDPIIILQSPEIKSKQKSQVAAKQAQLFIDRSSDLTLIVEENPNSALLAIHILLKHKAQYESQAGNEAAKILHDCLGQRLNSIENQKISNQFGLTYKVNDNPFIPMDNIYLDPDFSYIRAESLADDVKGVIDYLKGQLTNFQPTEDEFQKAIAKTKRPMMGMGSNKARQVFTKTYKSHIYQPDTYAINNNPLSYDDLKLLAGDYFHPSNMIISVVSPLAVDSIFTLFQWKANPPINHFSVEKKTVTSSLKMSNEPINEEITQGGERSFLFWGFVSKIEEKDKPALKALNLLLSDRIIFDVREKQGRAYRMQAGADIKGNHALFYINMGTRPENIDPLISQIPGFFDQKVVDSFTEYDLEKSINMYLGRMMFRRLSSINRAYYLGHSQYFHNDINYDADFHEALKNVTLADVKTVAQKYMVIKNPVTVVVR